ncbi:hypothetical protein [Haloarchaeobius sp. HME9146]|uniref:hypothetical protein n=1 Tax=Haloarchaeobius sp. HME9146 TaxID=2978732 RepID=UPI0021BFFD85|nr:hypothetical protein [Haloarchaeobius sp. HME9146]MCT9095721.1 hypothetical protein [Haloarchaeobius sp. HME9146]
MVISQLTGIAVAALLAGVLAGGSRLVVGTEGGPGGAVTTVLVTTVVTAALVAAFGGLLAGVEALVGGLVVLLIGGILTLALASMAYNSDNWVTPDEGVDQADAVRQVKTLIGSSTVGMAAATVAVYLL